uniref:Uncharacterized protein n=1 Tax=Anopheles culicifacies TaxID=139723 RepID=A0A182MQ27_9DIPT
MNHMAKYWPLADIHLDRDSPSLVYSSKPLYRFAVEAVIRSFSNNPRCPSYREAVEELPLGMRLDLLAEMCDYPSLVEVQLQILSDPLLFNSANQLQRLHDLQVSIFHSSSLFYFEGIRRTRHLSYKCAMQSLSKITKRSPSRLVIDVLRHFVRVCLYHRMYEKAVFTLKLAFCLVVHDYGRTSALYAGTLEDLAILLLACDQVTKSMEVYAEAQHIYMQLYGSRNLQLSLAQGNVAYGLCLQAYNTGRRDRALHHIALGLGNYKRNLPWEHRMVTQVSRLRTTIDLFTFPVGGNKENDVLQVELFNHKDIDPLSVKDIGYQLELIQHWENRSELELTKMMSDMYVLNYAEFM